MLFGPRSWRDLKVLWWIVVQERLGIDIFFSSRLNMLRVDPILRTSGQLNQCGELTRNAE